MLPDPALGTAPMLVALGSPAGGGGGTEPPCWVRSAGTMARLSSAARRPADWYRSAASLAMALVMTSLIAGGRSGRLAVTSGTGFVRWAPITDSGVPGKGGAPVRQ